MALPAPDPARPNWVSSDAPLGPRRVAPLALGADAEAGWARLVTLAHAPPRWRVVGETAERLDVVCTTRLLRFRDDLVLERRGGEVAVFSGSRVGHSDLGTNRRRVERLRRDLGGG